MERINASDFLGKPQNYIAELDLTTEEIEARWGPHEITMDDLGPWFTFAFSLRSGILAALVREVENAPNPGYILTAIGVKDLSDILEEFLTESGIESNRVTRRGFE
ncbi:hypothetical protein EKH77_11810 [Streptomyces luteoverticillatus]|uniref:Uncharacterized protein n=1 Tax=Streptomyces luteoverticillatus TaxID=66425 RepID=A0A3S9PHM4_STRLT|nr:hypothetical protein [Streptomyces luteoverticillatus]AZQ71805.1 hypothetical protein EKH77_11810 [Streptomyces luteoverticillatus]